MTIRHTGLHARWIALLALVVISATWFWVLMASDAGDTQKPVDASEPTSTALDSASGVLPRLSMLVAGELTVPVMLDDPPRGWQDLGTSGDIVILDGGWGVGDELLMQQGDAALRIGDKFTGTTVCAKEAIESLLGAEGKCPSIIGYLSGPDL